MRPEQEISFAQSRAFPSRPSLRLPTFYLPHILCGNPASFPGGIMKKITLESAKMANWTQIGAPIKK